MPHAQKVELIDRVMDEMAKAGLPVKREYA
jgi:hypothetical protein